MVFRINLLNSFLKCISYLHNVQTLYFLKLLEERYRQAYLIMFYVSHQSSNSHANPRLNPTKTPHNSGTIQIHETRLQFHQPQAKLLSKKLCRTGTSSTKYTTELSTVEQFKRAISVLITGADFHVHKLCTFESTLHKYTPSEKPHHNPC